MSRSKLAIRGFSTTLLFTAVTLVLGFWGAAVLQPKLGLERFGASRALQDWIMTLGVFDLGLSGAVAPLLARLLAQGRTLEAGALLRYAFRWYAAAAALGLTAGLTLWLFLDQVIENGSALGSELDWAWLALLAAAPTIAASPARAVLEARQQTWRANICLMVQAVFVVSLALTLVSRGWGMPGQTLAFGAGMWLFAIWVIWDAWRSGAVPMTGGTLSPELKREIWSLAAPTFLLTLFGRAALMSDGLIAAAFLGGAANAIFFNTTRLPSLVKDQLVGVAAASWAAMAELDSRGMREVFNQRLIELTRLTAVLGAAALAPIVFYNPHFVRLWVHTETAGLTTAFLAGANALGLAFWLLWGWCFSGTGRTWLTVAPSVVGGSINLSLSLILTPMLGVSGPLWGTFLTLYVLQLIWLARLLRRTFETPLKRLCDAMIRPLIVNTPVACGCWLAARSHEPGWIALAVEMTAGALISLAASWLFVFSQEERREWRSRFLGGR